MSQVTTNLYISDKDTAADLELLQELGITHIVNVSDYPNRFPKQFKYHRLKVADSGEAAPKLINKLPSVLEFINSGTKHGTVLVHCTAGVSRSATIVMAYLMKRKKISESRAFKYLKKKHPRADPNIVFRAMLIGKRKRTRRR